MRSGHCNSQEGFLLPADVVPTIPNGLDLVLHHRSRITQELGQGYLIVLLIAHVAIVGNALDEGCRINLPEY